MRRVYILHGGHGKEPLAPSCSDILSESRYFCGAGKRIRNVRPTVSVSRRQRPADCFAGRAATA